MLTEARNKVLKAPLGIDPHPSAVFFTKPQRVSRWFPSSPIPLALTPKMPWLCQVLLGAQGLICEGTRQLPGEAAPSSF